MGQLRNSYEDFIRKLNETNPEFLKGYEILGEYKGLCKKILVRHEYGLIEFTPNQMLRNSKPTIFSIVDINSFMKNKFKDCNKRAYEEIEFLEEIKTMHSKVLSRDRFGEVNLDLHCILKGEGWDIKSAVNQTEYFLAEIEEKWGKDYFSNLDFSNFEYKGYQYKVELRCKMHNIPYVTTPKNLRNGCNCRECYNERLRFTRDGFISAINERNPKLMKNILSIGEYTGTQRTILVETKYGMHKLIASNLFNTETLGIDSAIDKTSYFRKMLQDKKPEIFKDCDILGEYSGSHVKNIRVKTMFGTIVAQPSNLLKMRTATHLIHSAENKEQFFKNKVMHIHSSIVDFKDFIYKGNKTLIVYKCSKHGWCQPKTAKQLLERGCQECGWDNLRKTHEGFIEELLRVKPDFFEHNTLLNRYKTAKDEILFEDKYGVLGVMAEQMLTSNWTIQSAKDKTKYFIAKCEEVHGKQKYDYSLVKYVNQDTKVKIRCREHDYVFTKRPYEFLSGAGCPRCQGSRLELITGSILDEYSIEFRREHRFNDCKSIAPLPFDFYIKDKNLCIECQGIQHYEPVDRFGGEEGFEKRTGHDRIKKEYCKLNNIKLLEIPYWDIKNIREILIKELNIK